jgi:hypothetical protein
MNGKRGAHDREGITEIEIEMEYVWFGLRKGDIDHMVTR